MCPTLTTSLHTHPGVEYSPQNVHILPFSGAFFFLGDICYIIILNTHAYSICVPRFASVSRCQVAASVAPPSALASLVLLAATSAKLGPIVYPQECISANQDLVSEAALANSSIVS
jgi:hypothetical protein